VPEGVGRAVLEPCSPKNVDLRESMAVLAPLAAIPANRPGARALAVLLSCWRGLERSCETVVTWAKR
jgi:hypothetical protein